MSTLPTTLAPDPTSLRGAFPWDKIQDGLYDWVRQCSGLPVIWGRLSDDDLQPPRAFASIDLVAGPQPLGLDGVGFRNATADLPAPAAGFGVTSFIYGLRSLSISVNFFSDSRRFSDSAMSYAAALLASLRLESVTQQLWESGLAARGLGVVRDLAELAEAQWVSRAAVDLDFCTSSFLREGDGSGYVNEIIGQATIVNGQNASSSPVTVNFDVKGT